MLDEGHLIKNSRSKLFLAARRISERSRHRLILTGTPLQNRIHELWSLFDFLMPGLLGSERQFQQRYAKAIVQSNEHKASGRDIEAGALALAALHRNVLPFILRRLKSDVLRELPPKIIQDMYCQLSPIQKMVSVSIYPVFVS